MRRSIVILAALASCACALGPAETDCITGTDASAAHYAPAELVLLLAAPALDEDESPYLSLKHGDASRAAMGDLRPETDPGVLARLPQAGHCGPATLRAFSISADPEYWTEFWTDLRPESGFEFGVGVPGLDARTELDVLGVALIERDGDGVVLGCGCLNR